MPCGVMLGRPLLGLTFVKVGGVECGGWVGQVLQSSSSQPIKTPGFELPGKRENFHLPFVSVAAATVGWPGPSPPRAGGDC